MHKNVKLGFIKDRTKIDVFYQSLDLKIKLYDVIMEPSIGSSPYGALWQLWMPR